MSKFFVWGNNMVWLESGYDKAQTYMELRLCAPKNEKIYLDFNPLKMSKQPDWDPAWEEWHCYAAPLRIYKQDYELLLGYLSKIYPTKDAFDGTNEPAFDICFDNWIGRDDWLKIISAIEQDLESLPENQKPFFINFLAWIREALRHTSIIVVEGNL